MQEKEINIERRARNRAYKKGVFMAEEMNIVTPEGAEKTAPYFHENIGQMKYDVVLHFAEKGTQTVKDKLKRVILHEAEAQGDTTNP